MTLQEAGTMTRRLPATLLLALLLGLLALSLGPVVGAAQAQTPDPSPGTLPTADPTGAGTEAPTDDPATTGDPAPTDVAPPTEEVQSVTGAANPVGAPLLGSGTVVDTILQTETLWYALDAAPGQRVRVGVVVVGRPDGPAADDTFLAVTVTDPQRQPLDGGDVEFTGQQDATLDVSTVEIPAIGGDQPLLSVTLRSSVGADTLQGTGYRLQLTVAIDGEPLPPAETAPPVTAAPADPQLEVTVTSPPAPPPGAPDIVGDVLPFALLSLAVGGFAGFELSRRGL